MADVKVGDRVRLTTKLNARSTDPVTGAQHPADSFKPIKRGTLGTVEEVHGSDPVAVVRFDGLTTRQAIRLVVGALKVVE